MLLPSTAPLKRLDLEAFKCNTHQAILSADILTSKVRDISNSGQAIDVTGLYNFASFDIMADLCFGHPLGLLAKNEFSPWVRSVFESIQLLPFMNIIHYYPILLALFDRFQPKSVTEQMEVHAKHSADRVDQRMQEGSDKPDIWNLVLSAQGTEKGLTLEEMHSNADIFMMAGSETTGKSIAMRRSRTSMGHETEQSNDSDLTQRCNILPPDQSRKDAASMSRTPKLI